MKFPFLTLTIFSLLLFTSCSKDTSLTQEDIDKQFNIDIQLIEDYLKQKNIDAQKTAQGVYYIIELPGEETKAKITNTVTTKYKGYYLDETQFDASASAEFPLFNVIQGWQIGIPKYGKGGKGKLFIPSKFGYGNTPPSGVRSNAVLIFDIEILDIK